MYKLSPSKAHRFLNCTKSLEYDIPFVDSPATIRGSLLHEIAEKKLKGKDTREMEDKHGLNSYEKFLIDQYVHVIEEKKTGTCRLLIEKKKSMRIFNNDINFIIDALVIGREKASIVDLKTGNVDISPQENEQLLMYAFSVVHDYPQIKLVDIEIFQKGKLKTETLTSDEILDFIIGKKPVFDAIERNELTFNPSEKACKFCEHKNKCRARAEWIIKGGK